MQAYRTAGQRRLLPENRLKVELPLIHPEFCKRLYHQIFYIISRISPL